MKRTFLAAALTALSMSLFAQDIQLPAPNTQQASKSVVEALMTRSSIRSFSDKELTLQQIADLCWATCGTQRDADHITAPTAMNRQEITLYVFTKDGAYEYLRKENKLAKKADGDHRRLIAGAGQRIQEFVLDAPVSLLLVMDFDKFGMKNEHAQLMAAVDAGIATQNIDLYCEAVGLATVPRATMDTKGLSELLQLNENQIPAMNNPVGYAK